MNSPSIIPGFRHLRLTRSCSDPINSPSCDTPKFETQQDSPMSNDISLNIENLNQITAESDIKEQQTAPLQLQLRCFLYIFCFSCGI